MDRISDWNESGMDSDRELRRKLLRLAYRKLRTGFEIASLFSSAASGCEHQGEPVGCKRKKAFRYTHSQNRTEELQRSEV